MKDKILLQWLNIDLNYIGIKLNMFSENTAKVDDDLIKETIRVLDYETTVEKNPSINYVITIIALMWEYVDKTKYDLRKVIVKFLSRIGYPTSAIIVDDNFNKNECSFTSLGSFIDELTTTLNQSKNEIVVNDKKYLLTDFQKEIWDSMHTDKLIGISAPTSAGKSFIILLYLLKKIIKEKIDIVYIVPTLSLLNQVTEDFNNGLKSLGITDYKLSNSFSNHSNEENNFVYVLTQEKTIAAFSNDENAFSKNLILVVDEVQNIERIKEDNDERAKILFDVLHEFRYKQNVQQIIISGPRIEDIEKTGNEIFGIEARGISTIASPVLNITYSIAKHSCDYYLKQYCALLNMPIEKKIDNADLIKGYGKKEYDDDYLQYLNCFIDSIGQEQQNIIFSPTSSTARNIANSINREVTLSNEMVDLIRYYKDTIHPNYTLCKTLENGSAYHHGKLPLHVRRTLEKAIHEKWINNIACTTTLLQGVNLPAQNIIIRNPHLYLKRRETSAELSNYEMANLRGRAGRLLKDFIGRTFVMDETSFINNMDCGQISLFEDVTKELPSGYHERYEKYKDLINQVVLNDYAVTDEMKGYGDLVTYIRQSVLKHGEESIGRMNNAGVMLSREQVAAIIQKLNNISVPKEICFKNRYWDPFVLDSIYKSFEGYVPSAPNIRGAKSRLDEMLKFLRDTEDTSGMYKKYIPECLQSGRGRTFLKDLCMKWSNEKSLSEILSDERYNADNGVDEIENTIKILQNTVSYSVPLLLKPLIDIKNPDSTFLTCLEVGAFNSLTKRLIEIGVPRETALMLNRTIFDDYNPSGKSELELENDIRHLLKQNEESLPFWIKIQLEFLL